MWHDWHDLGWRPTLNSLLQSRLVVFTSNSRSEIGVGAFVEKMGSDILRKEFRLVQFRLLHPNAEDFAQSPVSFDLQYTVNMTTWGRNVAMQILVHSRDFSASTDFSSNKRSVCEARCVWFRYCSIQYLWICSFDRLEVAFDDSDYGKQYTKDRCWVWALWALSRAFKLLLNFFFFKSERKSAIFSQKCTVLHCF